MTLLIFYRAIIHHVRVHPRVQGRCQPFCIEGLCIIAGPIDNRAPEALLSRRGAGTCSPPEKNSFLTGKGLYLGPQNWLFLNSEHKFVIISRIISKRGLQISIPEEILIALNGRISY